MEQLRRLVVLKQLIKEFTVIEFHYFTFSETFRGFFFDLEKENKSYYLSIVFRHSCIEKLQFCIVLGHPGMK